MTSVMASSERGEHIGNHAALEYVSEKNNTLLVWNINDETGNKIPDEVSELSVPDTHFDRQPQTHHSRSNNALESSDILNNDRF